MAVCSAGELGTDRAGNRPSEKIRRLGSVLNLPIRCHNWPITGEATVVLTGVEIPEGGEVEGLLLDGGKCPGNPR